MAAEPWFSVRENDIFPEEFLQFLGFPRASAGHAPSTSRRDFQRRISGAPFSDKSEPVRFQKCLPTGGAAVDE